MRGGPRPGGGGLIAYFARHPTAANLLLAAMLLAGLWGAAGMRTQFFPEFSQNRAIVSVAWPGAGPEDVDRQIVAALTPGLQAVEGVESMAATASDGRARIVLNFESGVDMTAATAAVETAANAVAPDLPEDAERPQIRRVAFSDSVADVLIHGPTDLAQLTRHALELQGALFAAGVTRVALSGADEPVIRVRATETALARHDLTLRELAGAVSAATRTSPAGSLGEGGARVRAGSERRTAEAIGAAVARRGADGALLRVRDVARIAVERPDDAASFFVDGEPAVRLRVRRGEGGDAVAILRSIEGAIAAWAPSLPAGVEATVTQAQARQIADRLDLLTRNAATGLALVLGLLFLFLSARTAVWVAAGIPASIAAALALMHAAGLTLDMISLFALILCLGIIVDDAIVVAERADTLRRDGLPAPLAAERAAVEMFPAVFAAAATTVIAFLGLMVVGGRFGDLIVAIPLTVTMVLAASLIESLLVLPAHLSHGGRGSADRWLNAPSRAVNRGFSRMRDGLFRPLVAAALRLRYPLIGAAAGLLLASFGLLASGDLRWRFFDGPERGRIDASFVMLPGATAADAQAALDGLTRALAEADARLAAEHGVAPVTSALGMLGTLPRQSIPDMDEREGELRGGLSVELIDPDRRPYTQNAVVTAWNEAVRPHPLVETLSLRGERGGPGEEALSATLRGADPRTLHEAAEALKRALGGLAAVTGIEGGVAFGREEHRVALTPRGEAAGFTPASLGRELRDRLQGIEAATFAVDGRSATVEVLLDRDGLDAAWFEGMRLRTSGGDLAALSELARVERGFGLAAIRRSDGLASASVTAELAADDPAEAADARLALEARILPEIEARYGVEARLEGLSAQESRFLREAALGFGLCLAGIYIALAWIFGSWRRPVTILLTIPFGAVGVLWGHHWMGAPLSMFSVVGAIGMAGIIINDSIVLSEAAEARARGRALLPALADAACDRLRAVFLTTATTVAGLAPMLFETSTQAQFLKPTVITLCFGLGFGMLMVLVLTPAMLAVEGDIARAVRAMRRLPGALGRRRRRRRA